MNFPELIAGLARKRPVFHSEADFQHALAWHIQETIPDTAVRLEVECGSSDERIRVDITLPDKRAAIELKYATRLLEYSEGGDHYSLSAQDARPPKRYDYWDDVRRLEKLCALGSFDVGYAVILTNDRLYWTPSSRAETIDADFRLSEHRLVSGTLSWGFGAAPGTIRNREEEIVLEGKYLLAWQSYSNVEDETFRYLCLTIGRQ